MFKSPDRFDKVNMTNLTEDVAEWPSDEETRFILKILVCVVTPLVSIFAVVGNIFSISVLVKHGLGKCSNILLTSLAIADIHFLVAFNSAPKIIYEQFGGRRFVGYSRNEMECLFVFFCICIVFDYAIGLVGLTLPMLITVERLVVVFFPLSFRRVVTPRRTWLAVMLLVAYHLSVMIYCVFWLELQIQDDVATNKSVVGVIRLSALFHDNPGIVEVLKDTLFYTTLIVPPYFTVVGCITLSIKLKISSIYRKKLTTSKPPAFTRTTKILLAVCAVYTFTTVFQGIPLYIPQYASYSLTDESPSNISQILYQVFNIASCVNSASNFIVYIVMNPRFRDTFKTFFSLRLQAKPKHG